MASESKAGTVLFIYPFHYLPALCRLSFSYISEQKSNVGLGRSVIAAEGSDWASNSYDTTPHAPLASSSTDTSCQHIYYHPGVILGVQASADGSLCTWMILEPELFYQVHWSLNELPLLGLAKITSREFSR